jgi:Domain of unknown function (DUF222)
VLEALGHKAGPEDTRTLAQRRHDALEEACHRLIAAGMVPGRDGQPLHVVAHLDLSRLAALPGISGESAPAGTTAPAGGPGDSATPGPACHPAPSPGGGSAASRAESRWSLARTVAGPGTWCPTGPDADAAACDATVIPVLTGHPDWTLLDHLISLALPPGALTHAPATPPGLSAAHDPPASRAGPVNLANSCDSASPASPTGWAGPARPGQPEDLTGLITPDTLERLRHLALQHAISLLSGPTGIAAQLRNQACTHPAASTSQPLDLGTPTPIIPPHLRRAVTLRDRHCQFPGCRQPPAACQIHHLTARAHGGPTALANLALLCRFHHLTVIHHWAWTLTRHPDGTTTATSPNSHTLHTHSPPQRAA